MKILIVDDHSLVREGMQAILARSELAAQCFQAWDAASMWQQLRQHADMALVLLDIMLPDTSGLTLLAELTEQCPELPVIMLSAEHDADTVRQSLAQGASGFLPKSSLNQVLLSAMHLVISGGIYIPPEALGRPAPPVVAGPPAAALDALGFTARQSDVLQLLLQGLSNKQICRELELAEPTVKIHVRAILRTLGVGTRAEAIAKCSALGVLPTAVD